MIVTSVNAILQRVPPKDAIAIASFQAKVGEDVDRDALVRFPGWQWLCTAPARCAIPETLLLRGGIVDLLAAR